MKNQNTHNLNNPAIGRIICLFVSVIGTLAPLAIHAEVYAGIELPGVPVEITDPARQTASKSAPRAATPTVRPRAAAKPAPVTNTVKRQSRRAASGKAGPADQLVIDVRPGVNTFIPISVGRLNRIVTPFDSPLVIQRDTHTTTEVTGSTIYVATDKEDLVTMFVTDGNDDVALSLTLMPKKIPPTDVTLRLATSQGGAPMAGAKARKWEESQDYVDTITAIMSSLATNKTPPGYSLRLPLKSDEPVTCAQPGLRLRLGQVLDGHNLYVHVYEAKNMLDRPLEINETSCYHSAVTAVASWPDTVLEPGQRTELYVIHSRQLKEEQKQTRPSVLGAWATR